MATQPCHGCSDVIPPNTSIRRAPLSTKIALTQIGTVLGTPSHMSPEQLRGDAVDRRTDIFSCGVMLYQ